MAINRLQSIPSADLRTAPGQPSAPAIPPGFTVCPPQLAAANTWQQEIYRLAYEQAKAAAAIPRHHRMLFAVWN
jgi:hypothetical protein